MRVEGLHVWLDARLHFDARGKLSAESFPRWFTLSLAEGLIPNRVEGLIPSAVEGLPSGLSHKVEDMTPTIHVYILRCTDGSYYVGTTEDLDGRENAHNGGRGAKYTFLRRPVQLVYSESYDSLEKAIERERQLKGWNRTKKKALIDGDASRLKQLSKRRT